MVDVTVNRSKGVNVTVDKKDTGEVVSSAQDTPTLINAGVASQIISSLSLLTGDVRASTPNQGDLLIYNGSFWTSTTMTGDANISNTGVITIDQTAVSGISNVQFNASEDKLQIILSSGGVFDTTINPSTGVASIGFDEDSGKNQLTLSNGQLLTASISLAAFDTDRLSEGSTNLYYTTQRANDDIDARVTRDFIEALDLSANNLDGLSSAQFLRSDESDTMDGTLTITQGMNVTGDIDITGDIIPQTNSYYSLGNSSLRFSDLYLSGSSIYLGDAVISTDGNTVVLSGGLSLGSDVTVSGNLSVLGTTTTIDTSQLVVNDAIITVASGQDSGKVNAGLEVDRGADANVYLQWNETDDRWTITNDGSSYSNITFTSSATLVGNTAVFTRDDSTTYDLDLNGLVNGITTGTNWYSANNTLQLTADDGSLLNTTINQFGANVDIDTDARFNFGSGGISIYNHSGIGDPNIIDSNSNLRLQASIITLAGTAGTEPLARGTTGGAFVLYHDAAQKLTTKSNGVTVNGDLTATTLTGDGKNITSVNATDLDGENGGFYRIETASFEASNNTITFTRGDANTFDVTVSGGVTSGSLVGNTIILTKSDSSTVEIDINSLVNGITTQTAWYGANNTLQLTADNGDVLNTTIDNFDNLTADNINVTDDITSNTVTATRFIGDGTGLTGITATDLDGENGGFYRVESADYTSSNNTITFTRGDANTFDVTIDDFNNITADNITVLDDLSSNTVTANRFVGDGSQIHSVNATDLDSQNGGFYRVESAAFESTNNTITFTRGDANTFDVVIGGGVTSGQLVGNTIVLTKSDSTTIDIDVNSLVNDVIQSGSYSVANNTLSLVDDQNDAIDIQLTGLANTSSPEFSGSVSVGETLYADSIIVDRIDTNTQIIQSHLDFNPVPETQTYQEGRLFYDNVHKTFNYNTDVDNVHLELGENVYIRVYNDTSNTILNGSALYLSGYTSTDPVVPKAQLADASDGVKYNTSGLAAHSIEPGTYGYCVVNGIVRGSDQDPFDTSYLTAGVRAFVSFDEPGKLVQPAPSYPNYPMCMGLVVVSDANNGVFVIEQQMHAVPNFRVAGDVYVGNDLTVAGDFNVLGTETTTSVTNLNVANTFMYLGTGDAVANTEFVGSGLNDAEYRDYYNGTATKTYSVRIDGTGTPDTFEWSVDDFATTEATGVAITGGDQLLNDHIKIHFEATTGHTLGDRWDGDVAPTNLDHGVTANFSNSTLYTHAGYFRDSSDDKFKFFKRYDPEVSGSINTGHASFQYADLVVNSITGHTFTANLVGDVSGIVSDISNHDTDALSEGATNLYYTTARANSAIDNRVTRSFVNNLNINAQLLDSEEGGFYRVESASFESTNNTITFTRGDANTFDVTIGGGVTSGQLVGNTIVLTKSDSSTIDIDVNSLVNDIILSGSYSVANNTLSLVDDQSDAIDIQLTGLANTSSPIFSGSIEVADNIRADSLDVIGNISANNFSGTFVGDGSGITGVTSSADSVTSGQLVGNTIVLTKSDSSTIDIDVNALVNDIILAGQFYQSNNTIVLTDDQSDEISINLDGVNASDLDGENGGFYRIETASFESTNNTITFTRGDANTFDVTIGGGVTSGALVGNTIVLTKSDSSTIEIDVNPLVNDIILSGSYSVANNTLSLTDDQNDAIDIQLTGLANTSSPIFTGSIEVGDNIRSDSLTVEQIEANTITSTYLEVNRDLDGNTFLGKAVVGSYFISDSAAFAHIDHATSTGYALSQTSGGTTLINSADRLGFRIAGGGTDEVSITSTGLGIGIQAPQHALHVTSGNAVISGSASGGGHLIVNNSIITDSIEATGSITANVFIGDGSQLTGLSVANTSTTSGSFDISNTTIRFIRADSSDFDVELTGVANTSSPIFTGSVTVEDTILTDSITAVGDVTANVGVFNQIGVNKEPSSGFEIDVNGDINFTGGIYYNGVAVDFTANSEPLVDNGIPVTTYVFTGNGSNTVFFGTDDRSNVMTGLGQEGQFQVFLNGVRLFSGTDFTANSTHVTFTEAPLNDAKIQITAYEQFNDDLKVKNHSFYSANSIVTDGTTTEQVVDSYLANVYGTAKYVIQVKETGGNNMLAAEGLVVHDGAGATITTYGIIDTGTDLGTFDVDINSGSVRLLFTPSSASYYDVKVQRTTLSI